jgi:hypothetical protein
VGIDYVIESPLPERRQLLGQPTTRPSARS